MTHVHVDVLARHDLSRFENLHLIGVSLAIHAVLFGLAAAVCSRFHAAVSWASAELTRTGLEVREKERLRRHLLQKLVQSQEDERLRISRDLHDDVTQLVSGVMLYLEPVVSGGTADPEQMVARARSARETAREALDALGRLVEDLRPPVLDHMGLPAAVGHLLRRLETLGLTTRLDADFTARLPEEVEVHLFRVVQEALTNVARHARASRVEVRIRPRDGELLMEVQDDGRGFRVDELPGAARPPWGLMGMRERM